MATEQVIFFEGRFVPAGEAKVSVMTHALNYGTGCFEGIRGYADAAGDVLIFRLREHIRRLLQSSHVIGCGVSYDGDRLCDLVVDLVRRNEQRTDVYIRPMVYKSGVG
ncbi:MAG: aminotransferase class IV, partial [Chloroflexota bacterium]